MTYKIVIRKNDRKETFVGSLGHNLTLSENQATTIAVQLNTLFAVERVNWFVKAEVNPQ